MRPTVKIATCLLSLSLWLSLSSAFSPVLQTNNIYYEPKTKPSLQPQRPPCLCRDHTAQARRTFAVLPPMMTANAEIASFDEADNQVRMNHTQVRGGPTGGVTNAHDFQDKVPFPVTLWKFTRPHTIIGSALAIPSIHMLAAPTLSAAFAPRALTAMVYAMVPALLMNLYITGLNQITDVEIDKVNKPNLPIAAGLLSMRDATIIVIISVIASLGMGLAHPVFGTEGLNVALWGSGILGTLYSLPPVRLKRFPLLAAFCIVSVRGFIINASFFAHSLAAAYGGASAVTGSTILHCLRNNRSCFLSSLFFGVFGLVIALMKDVPDVLGDRIANVRTFSVRLGQKRVFHGMRRLLSGTFWAVGGAFARSALSATSWTLAMGRIVTSLASVVAGWSVRREAQGVDPEDSKQVYDFYMHLWKLFYLSYFVLPFAR